MNHVNPEHSAERLEEARSRISTMFALADVLGTEIGVEEVRAATLIPLSPATEMFAAWSLSMAQRSLWAATLMLAGQAQVMDEIYATKMAPARRPRRPRRPRPTAAERAQAATKWLNGPAWELGPEPEPRSDGGCP